MDDTLIKTKKVPCSYKGCSDRRPHYERPHEKRLHRMIEVPEDFSGDAYCSIECQVYDKPKYNPVRDIFEKESIVEEFEDRIKYSDPDRLDT